VGSYKTMLEIVCDQLSHLETQKHYIKN
jgi:hypothetical protein